MKMIIPKAFVYEPPPLIPSRAGSALGTLIPETAKGYGMGDYYYEAALKKA